MFLELTHTKLGVFKISKELVLSCYKETISFPPEQRFAVIQQIRKAALSVHPNAAEACSRKSVAERKRFYELARGSVIEVDTAFDIVLNLGYTSKEKLADLRILLIRRFQLISKMIC